MKFFGWMQTKLNGRHEKKIPDAFSASQHKKQESREEFSDWPHGLLAIGTFGNNEIKDDSSERQDIEEEPSSSEEIVDFSPEEVGKLQKELTKLLSRKPNAEKQVADLPLDRFLNCPSSLEVDRRISNPLCSDSSDDKDEDIERTISLIIGKCKDICANSKKKAIGKKSISFLLKKLFFCGSGFTPVPPPPPPSLRETLQESRMEKLLRTILQKKISPQNSSRSSSLKRYIEDKQSAKNRNHEEEEEHKNAKDGSKWVKTDSEYIVLEI